MLAAGMLEGSVFHFFPAGSVFEGRRSSPWIPEQDSPGSPKSGFPASSPDPEETLHPDPWLFEVGPLQSDLQVRTVC